MYGVHEGAYMESMYNVMVFMLFRQKAYEEMCSTST